MEENDVSGSTEGFKEWMQREMLAKRTHHKVGYYNLCQIGLIHLPLHPPVCRE